jgi:hypothetical protein
VYVGLLGLVGVLLRYYSNETFDYFIRVTKIGELGTTQTATSNRRTLRRNRATRRNNPEDTILHSHRSENLKSYSVLPSSPILVTLMKEALGSSKTSVITRATRRNIPEDTSLHSHRRENLKSYIRLSKYSPF